MRREEKSRHTEMLSWLCIFVYISTRGVFHGRVKATTEPANGDILCIIATRTRWVAVKNYYLLFEAAEKRIAGLVSRREFASCLHISMRGG